MDNAKIEMKEALESEVLLSSYELLSISGGIRLTEVSHE